MKNTALVTVIALYASLACAETGLLLSGVGLTYGDPLSASVYGELMYRLVEVDKASPECDGGHGPVLVAEAGLGGGLIGLGYGYKGMTIHQGGPGVSLVASLVRPWGDPVSDIEGDTYWGPELRVSITPFFGKIGYLRSTSGDDDLISFAIGVGL